MWRKLVGLAIYISICMGVPRDHRNSTPNLYKQGTTSIDQYKEDERRETEKDPVQTPSENSPRISGQAKISLELEDGSKSRDEQLFFKDNQETIVASLTPSVDLSHFRTNE